MSRSNELRIPSVRPDGIQLNEDIDGQRRAWVAERVGWAVMGVLAVAALIGLFGPGPLSQVTATSPDGSLTVNYQRFARYGGQTAVQIQVSGPPAQQPEIVLRIGETLLDEVQLEQTTPEPSDSLLTKDGVGLVYGSEGTGEPLTVTLGLRPDGIGPVNGTIEVLGGSSVTTSQLFYP